MTVLLSVCFASLRLRGERGDGLASRERQCQRVGAGRAVAGQSSRAGGPRQPTATHTLSLQALDSDNLLATRVHSTAM